MNHEVRMNVDARSHVRQYVAGLVMALLVSLMATACMRGNVALGMGPEGTESAAEAARMAAAVQTATVDGNEARGGVEPEGLEPTVTTAEGSSTLDTATADESVARAPGSAAAEPATEAADVAFTLQTAIVDGRFAYVGVGGVIDGLVNPTLRVEENQLVAVTLVNTDGMEHDVVFPDLDAATDRITDKGTTTSVVFRTGSSGAYAYYCAVPGHRAAGMEGRIVVGDALETEPVTAASVVRDPAGLPSSVGGRPAQLVRVNLEAVELVGQLADGTAYEYWTFDGQVPGPFIRVRVGDTVELHLSNQADSRMAHSIDLHAVTGPGGGAAVMQVPPGEDKAFTFQALKPGLYVYHCATPMVAHHIANGMYGLILVEPEGGLRPVDREFYVMQGEVYTLQPYGQQGELEFDVGKLLAETPEYFVFNGAVGALTEEQPLQAEVGDTVRIFFGVGGPNFTSSFHVIGEIFDRVYDQASLEAPPLSDVQTTLVAPGGATVVEFTLEVPGRYILVDHALSRLERGLVGFLLVTGEDNPAVFREGLAE